MNYLDYVLKQVRKIGLNKCYITYYPNDIDYNNVELIVKRFCYINNIKVYLVKQDYNRKVVEFYL